MRVCISPYTEGNLPEVALSFYDLRHLPFNANTIKAKYPVEKLAVKHLMKL